MKRLGLAIAAFLGTAAPLWATPEMPPMEWHGAAHHLAVSGVIEGEAFSFSSPHAKGIEVTRLFSGTGKTRTMTGLQVKVPAPYGRGQPISFELRNPDFAHLNLPDYFEVDGLKTPEAQLVEMDVFKGARQLEGNWIGRMSLNAVEGGSTIQEFQTVRGQDDLGLYLIVENADNLLMLSLTAPTD